ncbi:MAG: WD40 repeat domain-containing protein [Treponema sp.]|nr:WD40 repeat domain-containing protein [Treponema sp.]
MKKKIALIPFILVALFFTILYIILAAKPLQKDYQFTPVWKISTANPAVVGVQDISKQYYFHLGQTAGYFTEDGKITCFRTFPAKVSISDSYFALYNTDAANTDFFTSNGEKAGVIKGAGYPFIVEDSIFRFLPGGASFAKCDAGGETLWLYEGVIPITAFSAKENFCTAGFANGSIKVYDNKTGNIESDFVPGGSDYPVILGLDISNDGQYIASISGHNRQRFVLSHKESNQQKIIFHTFLDKETSSRTLVHFCKDSERVLYCCQDSIGIYNIKTQENFFINMESKIISIEESEDFVFLLGKNQSNYTVFLIDKTNTLEGLFSFEAQSAFINCDNNNLFIGSDSSISRIAITKE